MDATISEQLDILLNANYKWKKKTDVVRTF